MTYDDLGPIRLALWSLVTGAAAGAATITTGVLLVRLMARTPAGDAAAPHLLLPVSLFAGIVLAAGVAWRLARALPDGWRRAVTATLAAFGGLLFAALTVPVDLLAGRLGLAAWGAALLALAWHARRAAGRASVS